MIIILFINDVLFDCEELVYCKICKSWRKEDLFYVEICLTNYRSTENEKVIFDLMPYNQCFDIVMKIYNEIKRIREEKM